MERSSGAVEQQSTPTTQRPLVQQLRDGEQHWAWKMGLRATMAILALLGIGCLAWLTAATFTHYSYDDPYISWVDFFYLPYALVNLSLSFIWCAVCILVPLLRRTHRPVHPGTAVAFDLILWLSLLVTALFTIAAILAVTDFGSGGVIQDYNYSGNYNGEYKLAPNGTWVYKITSVYNNGGGYTYNYTTGNYTYSNPTPANVTRTCPDFASCAAEDAEVNRLWRQRHARIGTTYVAAVVQWIGIAIHFALFVWACVDVHRRNSGMKQREMQGVADRLIRDMQSRGMITVNDPLLATRLGESAHSNAAPSEPRRDMETVPALGEAGPSNRGAQRETG